MRCEACLGLNETAFVEREDCVQVLGGEEVVVVKNEGVQDGDGLFEIDERGNTAHQPAYGQVRQTQPPFTAAWRGIPCY